MKLQSLSLLLIVTVCVYSNENRMVLAKPEPCKISAARHSIKSLLQWHFVYQIAAATGILAGAGVVGYSAYKLWNEIPVVPRPALEPINPPTIELDIEKLNWLAQKEFNTHIEELLNKNRSLIMRSLLWMKKQLGDQLNSVLVGVGITFLFNGLNNTMGPISKYITRLDGLLDRTIASIFHKNSLEWFVTSHINLVALFNNLEYYAALLEHKPVSITPTVMTTSDILLDQYDSSSEEELLHELVSYWNMFIQQLELALGFMLYKSEMQDNPLIAERMAAIHNKIQGLVSRFAQALEENIQNNDDKSIECLETLKTLRAQLGFELSNFSVLEAFKRVDFITHA